MTPSTPSRRVFITGGAHGIGRAMVEAFAAEGHRVAFCDVNADAALPVVQATGARFFALDVQDVAGLEATMAQLFADWGDLDVIVNNVGVSDFRPLTEMSVDDFDRSLATNLRPVFVTARYWALHRHRLSATTSFDYGRLINLCSTRHLQSEEGTEGYSASKGGIRALTHALAISLSPYGITSNCLSPGWIHVNEAEELRPLDHAFHPSRRVGLPLDIARAALFLCAEGNDFINGQNITIDGGATIKMIYPE